MTRFPSTKSSVADNIQCYQDEGFDALNSNSFFEWFPWVSLHRCKTKPSFKLIRAFCTGPLGLHLYALLRFITGVGAIGCFMVCFVLAVEHVGFKVLPNSIENPSNHCQGENNTCTFQFTMLIGIAIEMPFALGEMLLGLEVILRELKIRRNDPFTGLLHPGLEDSSDGFLPSPARWRSIPWHSSLYRFGRTMVGCSRICALVGWGWKNKGNQLYCQV